MDLALGRLHVGIRLSWRAARGPAGEGALAGALRCARDARRLADLEPWLLRDMGLDPGRDTAEAPFRDARRAAWLASIG